MWTRWIGATGLVAMLSSTGALAFPVRHGPFLPGEEPTAWVATCTATRDDASDVTFSVMAGDTSLHLVSSEGQVRAQVLEGEQATSPRVDTGIELALADDVAAQAVCQDLNHDGRVDFVATVWRHGNGLGASFHDRLIALSSAAGYRFWRLQTMDPGPADFVRFAADEVLLITTQFASTGEPRPRSYLVHELWRFQGGAVVAATDARADFPKWVRYTLRENHAAAPELGPEEKRALRAQLDAPESLDQAAP